MHTDLLHGSAANSCCYWAEVLLKAQKQIEKKHKALFQTKQASSLTQHRSPQLLSPAVNLCLH